MGIIDDIAGFIEDLLGCPEECGSSSDPGYEDCIACKAKSKKYATWLIFIIVLAIILAVAPKIYYWYKGTKK